ncbi:uncharacterized protein LOC114289813 [Camellia sinensis]|uniref:uncharacterized protein LOC114289813 n=1 Tax=Camellia sinensis TaxID=4442 RepID=UPI001035E6F9|nr:uncharacterized protein LOC114289813 [Camellia sinensis]
MGYYLTDDIYPRWTTIMKTVSQPEGLKRQLFARMQEACQKDVERTFGVLQAHFNIVKVPVRGWSDGDLYYIMKMCIVLHNMIIEDGCNILENERSTALLETDTTNTLCQVSRDHLNFTSVFMLDDEKGKEGGRKRLVEADLVALAAAKVVPYLTKTLTFARDNSCQDLPLEVAFYELLP